MTLFNQSTPATLTINLAAGDALLVTTSGSVATFADTTHAIIGAGANSLTVDGFVSTNGAGSNAVQFNSGNHTVTVNGSGTLLSRNIGVNFVTGGDTLINSGLIYGAVEGVMIGAGAATSITNSGKILSSGNDAIMSAGSQLNLNNTGSIDAAQDGIDTFSAQGTTITNAGSIIGRGDNALDLSNTGADVVINNGYLQGANGVLLNGGNDLFDGRNGVQVGGVDGGAGDDTLYGGRAVDSLYGSSGADTLFGGGEADTLRGGNDNDFLRGDAGADIIFGGAGFDTASYEFGFGAIIDLTTGLVQDGEGFTDSVDEVEQFVGSGAYRDVFIGNGAVNYFAGLGGNDYVIAADQGADVFNGGAGFDTISYYNSFGAVVNLAAGTAIDGSTAPQKGFTDTVVGFEEVYGSGSYADVLIGDAGANQLYGFGGNDLLVGGLGQDMLFGGAGNDMFGFNAGDFQAGVWDRVNDFSEALGNTDTLYFAGLTQSALMFGEADGGTYVSTNALGGTGGFFVVGATLAMISDQLIFA